MLNKTITLTIAGGLLWALAACGGTEEEEEFRGAVPTRSALALSVPDSAAPGGETGGEVGSTSQALLGQVSTLYALTYKVSHQLNGSIWVGLNTIESIVQHRPSSIVGGVATWGPWTPPLEPLTWRLVVKRTGPGQYAYTLSARHKANPRGAFAAILAGTSVRGYSPVFSGYKGVYTANASNLHALAPAFYRDTGKMAATYDTTGLRRQVKLVLSDFSEKGGPKASASYSYLDRADTSGEFRFAAHADLKDSGSRRELMAVKSAWDARGAGRGDAAVTGGDLPAGVTVKLTECWNAVFRRVFYIDNLGSTPTEGKPQWCVFKTPLK
jgi:hypothetical protein